MTKRIKILCSLVILSLVIVIGGINSYALTTGFSVDDISESEKENIDIDISLVSEAPSDKSISRFDVNENGMIALGHKLSGMSNMISVYDSDGNFKYGYSFDSYGTFGVEWDGDYLNIYFVRSDLLVTVDCEANIIGIAKVQNTKENNDYGNYCLYGTERVVGDTKYTIRNRMGVLNFIKSSHSQLVKTSADGTEIILYDVNTIQLIKRLLIIFLMFALFGVAIYVIFIKPIRQNKKENN